MTTLPSAPVPVDFDSSDAFSQHECWPDGFDFPDRLPPAFDTLLGAVEHEAFCYRSWATAEGDLMAEAMESLAARIRAVDAKDVETFLDREDGVLQAMTGDERRVASIPATAKRSYRETPRLPGYCFGDDGTPWSSRITGTVPGGGLPRFRSEWRPLKVRVSRNGYARVKVAGKEEFLHRLILEAFVGPCPDGMVTCHGDGNRLNNRLDNLRWDTPKNNKADQFRHGTAATGHRNGTSVLSEGDLETIARLSAEGHSNGQIATALGVSRSAVQSARTGRTYGGALAVYRPRKQRYKLTEADIPVIHGLRQEGMSYAKIGRKLNVSASTVHLAAVGRTWRRVVS